MIEKPTGASGIFALLLSLFVMLVMPVLYALVPLFAGSKNYETVLVVLLPIGVLLFLVAVVLAIRAYGGAGRSGLPTAVPILALVFSFLSILTGAAGWVAGFGLMAGGGPR